MLKSVCIFCGSSAGSNPLYAQSAKELGVFLAEHNFRLVYGGASIGVMGAVAQKMIDHKGTVVGIMPQSIIDLEVAHKGLSEFIKTDNMHERKQLMHDMSEIFIALPGGMGTMDELCETITWSQLDFHKKPTIIFNINGYYDHFVAHIRQMNREGFYSDEHMKLFTVCSTLKELENELLSLKGV